MDGVVRCKTEDKNLTEEVVSSAPLKTRYSYVDYGKAIGICLIILAHVTQYFQSTKSLCFWICSFHVPVFFMLGGILTYHKSIEKLNLKKFLIKRTKDLLIPYVIFSLINSVLKLGTLFISSNLTKDVFRAELFELLITGNGTVWFLLTYFFVEILFMFVLSKTKGDFWLLLTGLLGGGLAFLNDWTISPVGILFVRVLAGYWFYIVGYFTIKYFAINKLSALKAAMLSMICLGLNIFVYLMLGNGYAFFEGSFTKPWCSIPNAIFGGFAIIFMAQSISQLNDKKFSLLKKVASFLGENSLIIMLVHPTILLVFTYPLRLWFIGLTGGLSAMASWSLFIIVVLLDIPCVYLIKRFFPWMIGKRKILEGKE